MGPICASVFRIEDNSLGIQHVLVIILFGFLLIFFRFPLFSLWCPLDIIWLTSEARFPLFPYDSLCFAWWLGSLNGSVHTDPLFLAWYALPDGEWKGRHADTSCLLLQPPCLRLGSRLTNPPHPWGWVPCDRSDTNNKSQSKVSQLKWV